MNFNFIPYKLNGNIADLKAEIDYVDTDNGVDLYRGKNGPDMLLAGIQVATINLYFFEASLITVYLHLRTKAEDIKEIVAILAREINLPCKPLIAAKGTVYLWQTELELLGLVSKEDNKMYLYFTLKKYSVL